MKDVFNYKFELVKQEMESVQKGIDIYNRTIFAIKGLAMTLFTAFITFVNKSPKPSGAIYFALGLILLLFWILDALFKGIQKVYIERAIAIETKLREPDFYKELAQESFEKFDFPKIEDDFQQMQKKTLFSQLREFIREFRRPTVALIYVAMIILTVVLYAYM